MSASNWPQALSNAALEIARAADQRLVAGPVADGMGRLLIALGKAAGHCDQLHWPGRTGSTARHHFRSHMLEGGVEALLLLGARIELRGGERAPAVQVMESIARGLARPGRGRDGKGTPAAAGHPAGAVGGALVAIGHSLSAPQGENQGRSRERELDKALELVIAHAITGLARALLLDSTTGG